MKKYLSILFTLFVVSIFTTQNLYAQGCVAIRHFSTCNAVNDGSNVAFQDGQWQIGAAYRYYKSFRHFKGTHEEADRVANNTEVINYANSVDLTLTYALSTRLSFNLTLPYVHYDRSSLYEHGLVNGEYIKQERRTTSASGLGDVRLSANYWLLDFDKHPGKNISVGLGIKLPTGDYNAQDYWYNVGPEGQPELRTVDQSIQPGDGGFGVTLEFNGYQEIFNHTYVYAGGFYLINPRETNGTRTYRETLVRDILDNEDIMAVPDQYMLRAGISRSIMGVQGLSVSAGARIEGVPVKDLVGGNDGFRRPGYVVSIEPGVNYMTGKNNFNLNVPIALHRNRLQSVTDKEMEQRLGIPRHGDAAFADYLISFSYARRF
ncbi:transporter [Catalinimonas niigatensis]|uniref:transporter n=1 Tax=Catalinimonas niigatensis TaxID=1397264 RepID=UPI002665F076|nr:transporter [Catalinimonas niigatensis]WPP51450.1 transporter [Catalinimonas niigatensis]